MIWAKNLLGRGSDKSRGSENSSVAGLIEETGDQHGWSGVSTEEQRKINSEMWRGLVTHSPVGHCKQSGFSLSTWEAEDGSKLRKEPEARSGCSVGVHVGGLARWLRSGRGGGARGGQCWSLLKGHLQDC